MSVDLWLPRGHRIVDYRRAVLEIAFDSDEQAHAFADAIGHLDPTVRAELFAGEDDAEDVSWLVTVACEPNTVESLVREYGGWITVAETATGLQPVDLPTEPRRFKNPRSASATQ